MISVGKASYSKNPNGLNEDRYTKYTTPEQEEMLKNGIEPEPSESWFCQLCGVDIPVKGQMDIDNHMIECKKSFEARILDDMKKEMNTALIAHLKPTESLMEENAKLKEELAKLQEKKGKK